MNKFNNNFRIITHMITYKEITNFPKPILTAIDYLKSNLSKQFVEKYEIILYGSLVDTLNKNKDKRYWYRLQVI